MKIEIRASSLSSFPDCMRRSAARLFQADVEERGYTLRELPQGIGAATGTATHEAAGYAMNEKIAGMGPNPSFAVDVGIESLRRQAEAGIVWDSTSPTMNSAERQVQRQSITFIEQAVPDLEPLAVELALDAMMGNIHVTGHLDFLVVNGVDDLKTGVVRRANGFQYGTYSLLARTAGYTVDRLTEHYVKRVPVSKPQPDLERYEYNVSNCEIAATAILKRMASDLRDFRDTADPWSFIANPMSMMCSDKYCSAWGTDFCNSHKDN